MFKISHNLKYFNHPKFFYNKQDQFTPSVAYNVWEKVRLCIILFFFPENENENRLQKCLSHLAHVECVFVDSYVISCRMSM